MSINNGILEFQKYQLTSHLSFLFNTSPHMQRYHVSKKMSSVATRVNVGSHKVKLSTTTTITPLPLVPSKNSGANVFSAGYIHVKKEISRFIPFKQGSKSGNTPFRFYKTPVANPKRQQGNHFIHHILKHFSFFYPP